MSLQSFEFENEVKNVSCDIFSKDLIQCAISSMIQNACGMDPFINFKLQTVLRTIPIC